MLGAIIGDIVGSRFEWDNYKKKDFDFFNKDCFFTDDSVMSLAICDAYLKDFDNEYKGKNILIKSMQTLGRKYPASGYGDHFALWITENNPKPYGSYGNGAAMRISGCGFSATSIYEVKHMSVLITEVSHNHPESFKGAEATAVAIYLARTGKNKEEIKTFIKDNYYQINFTLDEIRENYEFDESCQGTVPQALEAFFESNSFEDAIRNAISIGGDSDTIGAITGGIAEAYYGISEEMRDKAKTYLDFTLLDILERFEKRYGAKILK
ncbi:MAG: ADP-ribosylglycohydrolase family protein [Spirochaetaceae bacterium]|nr:ADP-ribosylglycohydrolase family protein [Spirochaetaceae bacterium]